MMRDGTEMLSRVDERLEQFIRQMPKVELHLHLEGTIRPATLLSLAQRHGVTLPATDVEGLRRWYQFRDFFHFRDIWLAILDCLRDGADFARITRELGETAVAQGVRYIEFTFTPATHYRHRGIPYDEVWGGIREGAMWVERELGVQLRFIPDIPRNRRPGDDGVEMTVEWAIAHRDQGVVALGLGGVEDGNPAELFADAFREAKAHGLRAWPHAGETVGPESVWGAVRALGADRLAHGVRAVEDPVLLDHLATHGIACDVCPTSNVCIGVYPSVAQNPIRRLLAAGVPVTLNTDDPPLFHTTLTDELLMLAQTQAFTAAELANFVRTGVEVSFLSAAEKTTLRTRIEAELADAAREAGVEL